MTITATATTTLSFSGARSGTSLATYGQQDMWNDMHSMALDADLFNFVQLVLVPPGMDVAEVLAAIGDLVIRHESLRTRFRLDADGALWQELPDSGEIAVEFLEADGKDPGELLIEAERVTVTKPIDVLRSWPLRLSVVILKNAPVMVILTTSHIATDMLSARLVRKDLADLIEARADRRPVPILPPRRQPLDQAAAEQSPQGQRIHERTLKYWRQRLCSAPATMFPIGPSLLPAAPTAGLAQATALPAGVAAMTPVRQETRRPDRFLSGTLSSEALLLAADVLALRYGVTTASVIMAAEAVILGHQAGLDRCAFLVCVGNRIAPKLSWSACNLQQDSLAVLDLSGASFEQLTHRACAEWICAQRAGMYHPAEVRALRSAVEHNRGAALDLTCFFNDLRTVTRPDPGAADITAERIHAATTATTFAWHGQMAEFYAKFYVRLRNGAGRIHMGAYVDTSTVCADKAREMLFGIERLLVWAATEAITRPVGVLAPDLDAGTVTEVTGIPAAAWPPGFVRVDSGWADCRAVAELLREATADLCSATAVLVERDQRGLGEDRLVGYVAARRDRAAPTPDELHRRCLAGLTKPLPAEPGWPSVTPHHYVICADAPGCAGDEDAWLNCRVIAEGSGRQRILAG